MALNHLQYAIILALAVDVKTVLLIAFVHEGIFNNVHVSYL